MGLFDMLKEKATELLQGAAGQVSDVVGADSVSGAADQVGGAVAEGADQLTQATDAMHEGGQNLVETTEAAGSEAATDAANRLLGE